MFERVAAEPLFPSMIWVHDLEPGISGPLNDRLAVEIDRLTTPRPPNPRNVWQTDQTLHLRPEFQELVEIFRAASLGVLAQLDVDYGDIEFTGCWANLNAKGGLHPTHNHPNNYLSGVYYVRIPPGSGVIQFHEPRPQVTLISPKVRNWNRFNATVSNIPVAEGRLLVFPSWLAHSVDPNPADALRISISFNIFFTNYMEQIAKPKWEGMTLPETDVTGSSGSN